MVVVVVVVVVFPRGHGWVMWACSDECVFDMYSFFKQIAPFGVFEEGRDCTEVPPRLVMNIMSFTVFGWFVGRAGSVEPQC